MYSKHRGPRVWARAQLFARTESARHARLLRSSARRSPANVLVWHLADAPDRLHSIWVVTSAKQGKIPRFSEPGLDLQPGAEYLWDVQMLGPAADMDAAAGPDGLADAFGNLDPKVRLRARNADGAVSVSGTRTFAAQ